MLPTAQDLQLALLVSARPLVLLVLAPVHLPATPEALGQEGPLDPEAAVLPGEAAGAATAEFHQLTASSPDRNPLGSDRAGHLC